MLYERFAPAKVPSSRGIPDIRYMQHTSGYAGIVGSVTILSSGEVAVAGADPAAGTILGVALAAANTAPGMLAANSPATSTGLQRNIAVAIANRQTIFQGYLTSGSSTKVAPALTDVGVSYGITAYSGIWTVDRAKTGATERVTVVAVDLTWGGVLFKFKEAAILFP